MLLGECFVFNDAKVKVSEGKSESGEQVSSQKANFAVLCRLVPSNDVEDHGEHDDQNEEEHQEDFEINDNTDDHGYDVAEVREDLHEHQRLDQASQNHGDQQNLRVNIPGAVVTHLENDVHVADNNMHNIDVVDWVTEVRNSLFEELNTIIVDWVYETDGDGPHVPMVTYREDSIIDLTISMQLS